MEILQKLGIHWQQILAQIVNFTIIATVLASFVYKPLLKTIDARSDRTRKAMENAARIEEQQKEMERMRQEILTHADREAGNLLAQAKVEAEAIKQQILDSALHEAESTIAKGRRLITEERRLVYEEVRKHLTLMVVRMTEKVLAREFSPDDQKRLIADLEKELSTPLR